MPICQKCSAQFPYRLKIDGRTRNLSTRKFCLKCSPFMRHNTVDLTLVLPNGRRCPRCRRVLSSGDFYPRRNRFGSSTYCKQCTNLQALERQRKLKQQAVEYKGGQCIRCGYCRYVGALEFHHMYPQGKDVTISHIKHTTFAKIVHELDKCILVCANCHREIHAEQNGQL